MKIYFVFALLIAAVVFSNCHSTKKAASESPKLSFENDVHALVTANCSPCHIPEKGGRMPAFDSYEKVKTNIDSIIARIELQPGQKGFMPFKRARLSDSTINVFKQWRAGGMMP